MSTFRQNIPLPYSGFRKKQCKKLTWKQLVLLTACFQSAFLFGSVFEPQYGRMVTFGVLHRVALVRTDVSEIRSASFIRVTRIGELGTTLAVTID
jgi:hypothetical protein